MRQSILGAYSGPGLRPGLHFAVPKPARPTPAVRVSLPLSDPNILMYSRDKYEISQYLVCLWAMIVTVNICRQRALTVIDQLRY